VRQDNGYPVKVQIQGSGSAQANGTPQGAAAGLVVTFTQWDIGVTITVPAPDQIAAGG
jgi:hypothetical protein